jgi:hypothetical protein
MVITIVEYQQEIHISKEEAFTYIRENAKPLSTTPKTTEEILAIIQKLKKITEER